MTVKNIEQNILKLNPLKRIRLIESLIVSLNKPDPTIERAWAAESDRRLKTYRNGSIKGIDWETVKKNLLNENRIPSRSSMGTGRSARVLQKTA